MTYINGKICPPACWLLWVVLGLSGCAGGDSPGGSGEGLLVLAAASTTDVMEEICSQYGRDHDVDVRTSYAASSALALQVVNGARAGVFVSANRRWADYLDEQGLVVERRDLLQNRLVVILPSDSTLLLRTPQDLLSEEIRHIALAEPESAPAGIYANGRW